MKYVISLIVLLFLYGCENKVESDTSGLGLQDTNQLQPKVVDKSLQPPTPPSIVVE